MTDHNWTADEQAVIEQAAADYLEHYLAPSDARDVAYDIARDIRDAIVAAATTE